MGMYFLVHTIDRGLERFRVKNLPVRKSFSHHSPRDSKYPAYRSSSSDIRFPRPILAPETPYATRMEQTRTLDQHHGPPAERCDVTGCVILAIDICMGRLTFCVPPPAVLYCGHW